MKKAFLLGGLSLILVLGSSVAWAQTVTIPAEHPSLMRGVRPIGMGNAFIAMPGTDENAPFYNPAAINDYEKQLHFKFISPTVDLSTGAIGLIMDVKDLVTDLNNASGDAGNELNVFRTFVNQHIGQFESVSFHMPPVMVMHKWFSAGLLVDSRNTVSFRNRVFTSFELDSRSDFGGFVGGAYGFLEDQIQAGLNVKVLHRLSIRQVITEDDVLANSGDFGSALPRNRAPGFGVDLGLKGKVPDFDIAILERLAPTVALTWQDIGNARFSAPVPDTNQSISFGVAVHPKFGDFQTHFAFDIRELNQSSTFPKKAHFGLELQAPRYFGFLTPAVRIGANQLYFAGGLTLDFRFVKLDFAAYGEEAGMATRNKELRRYAFDLVFGF